MARRGHVARAALGIARLRGANLPPAHRRLLSFALSPVRSAAPVARLLRARDARDTRALFPWARARTIDAIVDAAGDGAPLARAAAERYAELTFHAHNSWMARGPRALYEAASGCPRVDPYLDDAFVRFVASVPPEHMFHGGWIRGLFREAMRGLVPDSVRLRTTKAGSEPAMRAMVEAAGSFEAFADLADVGRLADLEARRAASIPRVLRCARAIARDRVVVRGLARARRPRRSPPRGTVAEPAPASAPGQENLRPNDEDEPTRAERRSRGARRDRLGSAPVVWDRSFDDEHGTVLRIGRAGDAVVAEWPGICRLRAEGGEHAYEPEAGVDPHLVDKIRLGAGAALLRHLDGKPSLHASARFADRCAGASWPSSARAGAGKSTLAAAACREPGVSFVADDVVALDLSGPAPMVEPAERAHWLDPTAVVALGMNETTSGGDKVWCMPRASLAEPLPLAAVVHLAFAEGEPSLVRRFGLDAVARLRARARALRRRHPRRPPRRSRPTPRARAFGPRVRVPAPSWFFVVAPRRGCGIDSVASQHRKHAKHAEHAEHAEHEGKRTTMTIGKTGRVRVRPHVFARGFDDELVLIDLQGGEYFGLDELGSRLWDGLEAAASRRARSRPTSRWDAYDVEVDVLTHDLVKLADELVSRGFGRAGKCRPR